jgi:hypothetical protein
MIYWQGKKRRTRRKTCHSATLSTTNPTWIDPGANPSLRGERPATNRLRHGTTFPVTLTGTVKLNAVWYLFIRTTFVWCYVIRIISRRSFVQCGVGYIFCPYQRLLYYIGLSIPSNINFAHRRINWRLKLDFVRSKTFGSQVEKVLKGNLMRQNSAINKFIM